MPMNPTVLTAALQASLRPKIEAKVRLHNPELAALMDDPEYPADLNWVFDALAEAVAEAVAEQVIPHIQGLATVNTAVTGLLTSPTAVAGTGIGTVT